MMHRWKCRSFLLAATMLGLLGGTLLSACGDSGGGGGSSGFDLSFAELERETIVDSASTLTCQIAPGALELCAVGEPVSLPFTPPPPGTPPPAQAPILGFEILEIEGCLENGRDCLLDARVLLNEDLEPGTRLHFAIRPEDLSMRWATTRRAITPAQVPDGPVTIVEQLGLAPGTPVLIAALVYPPGTEPPLLDGSDRRVELLSSLGAPLAGVVLGTVIPDFSN